MAISSACSTGTGGHPLWTDPRPQRNFTTEPVFNPSEKIHMLGTPVIILTPGIKKAHFSSASLSAWIWGQKPVWDMSGGRDLVLTGDSLRREQNRDPFLDTKVAMHSLGDRVLQNQMFLKQLGSFPRIPAR